MKKLLSLLMAALLLMALVPVYAAQVEDVDPTGRNIASTHSPYLLSGGNSSTTNFLTSADFAANAITIINVWSNGCGPCVNEMPYFQQIHEEYASQGVLVVGAVTTWINGNYATEYNYLQNNGYTYMNVIPDTTLTNLYQLNNYIPQTFFISPDGEVVDFIGGGTTYSTLKTKVEYYLSYYGSGEDHTVTFVDGYTNEVIETQIVPHRGAAVYPASAPEHEGCTFMGWSPAELPVVVADTTVTATYNVQSFRVQFKDSLTGASLGIQYVQYGKSANPPTPPEHEGYDFIGWDKDFSRVTSNMTVYAQYQEQAQQGMLGDIDLNNELSFSDVSLLYQFVLGGTELSAQAEANSDVDQSGEVAFSDVSTLYQMLVG